MTGKIRRILSERRGIALASVMIIFIVSAILVTGISSAVVAQANIIKSRENASQAYYYAYSAAESIAAALKKNSSSVPSSLNTPSPITVSGLIPTGQNASITSATITKVYEDAREAKCKLSVTALVKGQPTTVTANMVFKKPLLNKQLMYNTSLELGDDSYLSIDGDKTYRGGSTTVINEINSKYKTSTLPELKFNYEGPTYSIPATFDITTNVSDVSNAPQFNLKKVKFTANNVNFNSKSDISNSTLYFNNANSIKFSTIFDFVIVYKLYSVSLTNNTLIADKCKYLSVDAVSNSNIFLMNTDELTIECASNITNTIIYTNATKLTINNYNVDGNILSFDDVKIFAPNATEFSMTSSIASGFVTYKIKDSIFYLPNVTKYKVDNRIDSTEFNNCCIYAPKASANNVDTSGIFDSPINMNGIFYFNTIEYKKPTICKGLFYTSSFNVNYLKNILGKPIYEPANKLKGALITKNYNFDYYSSWPWNYSSYFYFDKYDNETIQMLNNYLEQFKEITLEGGVVGYTFDSMTYTKAS